MAGCKEAISLSSGSGIILERLSSSHLQQRSSFLASSSGDSSPGLSEETPASGNGSSSSTGSVPDVTTTKLIALSTALSFKAEREQASPTNNMFLPLRLKSGNVKELVS